MKRLFLILAFGLPAAAAADTFILKDGARLEGEVTGEMEDALLVKTRYGALTINKADVQERLTAAPPPAEQAPSTAAPAAAQPAAPERPVRLTFSTVLPSTSTRLLVYYQDGVAIATQTFDAAGAQLAAEGAITDGTYTEYYDTGALKTVKSMLGGKASGSLKAYYPSGTLQIEAYYMGGVREGLFKYYAGDGKPMMEAAYKNDLLNGWKKEFDAAGLLKSEAYYIDDRLAEPPKVQAPAEPAREPESMVTAKPMKLARGERFSFQLNGKYIGKATLDKDFNIISQEGKVPDGAVKIYSADGKLQKEFVFEKTAIKTLRVYEDGGPLKAEFSFKDGKAVKK
ncbi:MAG: hypothetical protein NDI60_02930 [Elusimicrobiales bacterium]|nr:hypothetical protein [Elusimicrobiales bacterium]